MARPSWLFHSEFPHRDGWQYASLYDTMYGLCREGRVAILFPDLGKLSHTDVEQVSPAVVHPNPVVRLAGMTGTVRGVRDLVVERIRLAEEEADG